jgi:diguanylate cyclase (GGDEF)-like protein
MSEELIERIRHCPNLPTLPTIAVEVLELAQRPDADIAEIARVISRDPALTGKILRTVNSSFYGRSQAVSTISQALVILGLQSVKTLVLGFSLVSNISKTKARGFQHIYYWKRSIYAATAARVLSQKFGIVQQEEAFLAALLKDIGMLVLDQVLGERYGDVFAQAQTHQDLPAVEQRELQLTHAQAGGILAEQWKLPPLLAHPIAYHHNPGDAPDPSVQKLVQLVALAGRCADVFVDESPAGAITTVRSIGLTQHQLSDEDCDKLLAEIGTKTKEVAALFEINIGKSISYEVILKRANEALIQLTLQSQQQAQQLEQQNQQLLQRATTDALTGLANRGSFDGFLERSFNECVPKNDCISLLMIDIDKFKSINDTHGHQTGDAVLAYIGKLLKSTARAQDLAARYGGEELSLILVGTPRSTAAAIAETIRRSLEARPVPAGGKTLRVTASIGVASWEPGSPLKTTAHLVKAADLAVYNAKKSGRNCVKVFTLRVAA